MAANNCIDGNSLFDFDTYVKFRKERLKLNYENTLKLWYSLPPELPATDNGFLRRQTVQEQQKRLRNLKVFIFWHKIFKRTCLKKKLNSKGRLTPGFGIFHIQQNQSPNFDVGLLGIRLWNDLLNIPSVRDSGLSEIYESVSRITIEFHEKSERYDSKLPADERFQAGRTVWFAIAYEMQFNMSRTMNDSLFGYTMLYPYTDNLLDCNDITREAKKDFAQVFHERLLNGESTYDPNVHFDGQQTNGTELSLPPSLKPFADRIGKIFDMVKFIENDWIRDSEHRSVYMALANIHESQMKSTLLHARAGDGYTPTMREIEEISADKGGASYIAIGFLLEGQLTRDKMAYLEYFGFGLQLLDDLQDVDEDMKNNHRTVFTQSIAHDDTLDAPTARLIQYFYSASIYANIFPDDQTVSDTRNGVTLLFYMHELMIALQVALALEAISRFPQYYSQEFYRKISARSPLTFDDLKVAHIEQILLTVVREQWF